MYLSRLFIKNYRSIQEVDIKFKEGKNVIVGRNNSGKSNILKAIDLVLGEYSPTYNKSENINENDFYCGNTENEIFIWCEIDRCVNEDGKLEDINFSDVESSAFFRIYLDKQLTREHRIKITDFNENEKINVFEFCSVDGQAKIDGNQFGKKWIGGKSYCKANFNTEFLDKLKFAIAFTCYKNENEKLDKQLVLLYKENDSANWIQGINCNLRNILLQSAIIPAFRDPKDQLRIHAYSWFGKLLKAYVKTDSQELKDAFNSVKEASNELFKNLKEKVTEKDINIAFPNTSISFQFNPDTKQDIHKSTMIYVDDGFNSELKEKGAGIQSAVTISLYDFYVRNIAHPGSSLLAIEEPELYLHPHGRRVISSRLSSFVNNGQNQVILTTHSTEFLANIHENQNIISVRKNKNATEATNIYFNTPKRKQILIKKQNAEMFFAEAVILTEGAGKYFIEESARCFGKETFFRNQNGQVVELGENWINNYNISIINCSGKTELWKYAEILNELNIDFLTTADFDFLRDGLSHYFTNLNFLQWDIDTLNTLKSRISTKVKGKYKYLSQLDEDVLIEETQIYLDSLKSKGIYIFTGELENFYVVKPSFDKEAGVIETLGKVIEQSKDIKDFVDVSEYYDLFTEFLNSVFGLKIYEQPTDDEIVEKMDYYDLRSLEL